MPVRDSIQVHYLCPYPASCIVRGDDGRPKMLTYGGVDRARISSAATKRAVRTSDLFRERFEGRLGDRTRRITDIVTERLVAQGHNAAQAQPAIETVMAQALAELGKVDAENAGRLKQLVFLSPEEIDALTTLVVNVAKGDKMPDKLSLLGRAVGAVDVAANGRMFADSPEFNMTAAIDVAHAFTVGKAQVETDFYVAVDDHARDSGEVAGGFMDESFYTAGLFYGYARIDMRQFAANLGGDEDLAAKGAAAYIEAMATVTPSGKRSNFATHSVASWVMVERGGIDTSLAGAFLRPVASEDQLGEAVNRASAMAEAIDRAYNRSPERRVMNLGAGDSMTLAEVANIAARPAT